MVNRPCIDCGTPTPHTRCEPCRLHANRERDRTRTRNRPSARQRGYDSEYERNRTIVLALDDVCWLCGHPGARQADHVIPLAKGGTSALDNLKPAHGTARGIDNPCPTCGRRCNQQRRHTP